MRLDLNFFKLSSKIFIPSDTEVASRATMYLNRETAGHSFTSVMSSEESQAFVECYFELVDTVQHSVGEIADQCVGRRIISRATYTSVINTSCSEPVSAARMLLNAVSSRIERESHIFDKFHAILNSEPAHQSLGDLLKNKVEDIKRRSYTAQASFEVPVATIMSASPMSFESQTMPVPLPPVGRQDLVEDLLSDTSRHAHPAWRDPPSSTDAFAYGSSEIHQRRHQEITTENRLLTVTVDALHHHRSNALREKCEREHLQVVWTETSRQLQTARSEIERLENELQDGLIEREKLLATRCATVEGYEETISNLKVRLSEKEAELYQLQEKMRYYDESIFDLESRQLNGVGLAEQPHGDSLRNGLSKDVIETEKEGVKEVFHMRLSQKANLETEKEKVIDECYQSEEIQALNRSIRNRDQKINKVLQDLEAHRELVRRLTRVSMKDSNTKQSLTEENKNLKRTRNELQTRCRLAEMEVGRLNSVMVFTLVVFVLFFFAFSFIVTVYGYG